MGIGELFRFDRFRNRNAGRENLKPAEREINRLEEIIKLQKSEINALRRERKRLLDHIFSPIPDYEHSQSEGSEIGKMDVVEEDLYDLQAGTQIEGEV